MIEAYKAGIPGNGKPEPDGAKMAKIHWVPKKNDAAPGPHTVPGSPHDVDFMLKDSKRFADGDGWGYAMFKYDPATDKATTPSVASRATRSRSSGTTYSRSTPRGNRSREKSA